MENTKNHLFIDFMVWECIIFYAITLLNVYVFYIVNHFCNIYKFTISKENNVVWVAPPLFEPACLNCILKVLVLLCDALFFLMFQMFPTGPLNGKDTINEWP